MTYIDISEASFDEFIAFLFVHDAAADARWYDNTKPTFDPLRVCRYYVQLFRQPAFLLERFSHTQLRLGFAALASGSLSCSAKNLIWNTDLPFTERAECVRAMFCLFQHLFAVDPIDSTAAGWWQSFRRPWEAEVRSQSLSKEDGTLQDVFYETISRVLELDSAACQLAALDGLEHLDHPRNEEAIQRLLARTMEGDTQRRAQGLAKSSEKPAALRQPWWRRA